MIGPRYLDETELPWPEGTHKGPDAHPDVDPVGRDAKWSLSGLATTHRLFNASLLLATGMNVDPVARYWAEANLDPKDAPYVVELDKVLFKGLPPPFDRTVFACPLHLGKRLIDFLDRVSVARPDGVWDSVRQRLPLVDWKVLQYATVAPPKPPTVEVDLYGLESETGMYYWKPPRDPWTQPISLAGARKVKATDKQPRRPFT